MCSLWKQCRSRGAQKGIWKELINEQLNKELYNTKELPMQGHVVGNDGADYLISQDIFHNHKVAVEPMQFWYKARHDVLSCYYILALWYQNQSASCALDGYNTESSSHVLNGWR